MKTKHGLALMAIVAAAIWSGAMAAEKVVILTNGAQVVGEVIKTKDGYQVRKPGGVLIVLSADQVDRIEEVKTQQSEFEGRLAKTDQKDPEKLYELARWASDEGMLTQARDVLNKVRQLDPTHEGARLLLRLVELRTKAATRPTTTGPSEEPPDKFKPSELLKKEDIYAIRLHELRRGDKVRVVYRNKVLDRFIESMRGVGIFAEQGGEARFRTAARIDQVRYILENTDRDSPLRADILIESDPLVIRQFRTRIWQMLSRTCGAASCHGGVKGAGTLKLLSAPSVRDEVVYTNFFILSGWARGGRKLMKRDNPEMSLLLQYGLPKDLARLTHPDPPRVEPIFRNPSDANYGLVLEWLKLLRHPVPGGAKPYGIDFQIPGQPTKPTTTTPSIFDE